MLILRRTYILTIFLIVFQSCKSQTVLAKELEVLTLKDSIKCDKSFNFSLKYNLPYLIDKNKLKEQKINNEILNELDADGILYFIEDDTKFISIKDKLKLFRKKIKKNCENELDFFSDEIEINWKKSFIEDSLLGVKTTCTSISSAGYNFSISYINIDLKQMKILSFKDVFLKDNNFFLSFLSQKIKKEMMIDVEEDEALKSLERKEKLRLIERKGAIKNMTNFYVTKNNENTVYVVFLIKKDWGAKHDTNLNVIIPINELTPYLTESFKKIVRLK